MNKNHLYLSAILAAILVCGVHGACPSADITGDCIVDFKDLAILASQWLTTDPCMTDDIAYIPGGQFIMGDSFSEGDGDEQPLHTVQLDSFAMGKFEVTNQQYCLYLNSALEQGLITVTDGIVYKAGSGTSFPYCDTFLSNLYSQIAYSGDTFNVLTKRGRKMSSDPMVHVTWYGAVAYCNWRSQQEGREQCYNTSTWKCDFTKHGYRLPTEAEWEYAARGGLKHGIFGMRFPWGDTISHRQANYYSYWYGGHPEYSYDISPTENYHPLWNDELYPYTSPVVFFDGTMKYKTDYLWPGSATSYQTTSGVNNYGLYDMAGNVREWCNDWYGGYSTGLQTNPTGPESGSTRVLRDGSCSDAPDHCRAASRGFNYPDTRYYIVGFRWVLNIN